MTKQLVCHVWFAQVHFYYNFSDWILPPSVPINRPFKIMLDQSIYFCSKCAVYILLVRYIIVPVHARACGRLRCFVFFCSLHVLWFWLAIDSLLIFTVRQPKISIYTTLETRFRRARHTSAAFVMVAAVL